MSIIMSTEINKYFTFNFFSIFSIVLNLSNNFLCKIMH